MKLLLLAVVLLLPACQTRTPDAMEQAIEAKCLKELNAQPE